jgi:hypothetical protein
MPFVISENIGPYRLVEQSGQSGIATVFKASHPAFTGDPKNPAWTRWVAEYLLNKAKN